MRTAQKKQLIGLIGLIGLMGLLPARAQFAPESVSLVASPSSPQPGQETTIQAATPTSDQASAVFSWTIDGRARPDLSGRGKHTITLIAGNVGSSLRVSVDAATPGGRGGSASLTIRVSDVALAWFAETYVPPWYRGKALPSPGSVIALVAIPNIVIAGSRITPDSLIYRWSLDDQKNVLAGAGQQVFRVKTSDLPDDSHRVEVVIEDAERRVRREERIFIAPAKPKILLYASSPLGGIEPRSAATASFRRGLLDFFAEPFFFPVSSKKELSFEWRLGNGVVEGAPQNPWIITVDTGTESVGTISLFAAVKENVKNGLRGMGSINLVLE